MKKIHFNHLSISNPFSWILLPAFLICIASIFFLESSKNDLLGYLVFGGNFLLVVYFSKMFVFRNYFEWNAIGGNIKINTWWPKNFRFTDIEKISFDNKIMHLTKISGETIQFDFMNIESSSIDRLLHIFEENNAHLIIKKN